MIDEHRHFGWARYGDAHLRQPQIPEALQEIGDFVNYTDRREHEDAGS